METEKPSNKICYIDTETTGLDPRIHQVWEICTWLENENEPQTSFVPHTLKYATPEALKISGWYQRHNLPSPTPYNLDNLITRLNGATLVGSNPSFDANMLLSLIGSQIWKHRLINVSEGGMWIFKWDTPKGLIDVAKECRLHGYDIPDPDHTAEGDVRTTKAVHLALKDIRKNMK